MVDQGNFNVKNLKAKVSLQVIYKLIDMGVGEKGGREKPSYP